MPKCPCQSGKDFAQCCQPYLSGASVPRTPEALMRSRYCAYTQADVDYIARTMQGKAARGFVKNDAKQWAQAVTWLGLNVINHYQGSTAEQGFVEFAARFKNDHGVHFAHEISEFSYHDGQWFYIDGEQQKPPSRNSACLCGSGKKLKRCCLR